MKLVLFDIDNTLLKSSKAHQLSFVKALTAVFNRPFSLKEIHQCNQPGLTDPQIISNVLVSKGISPETIKEKWPLCQQKAVETFADLVKEERLVVLPGVRAFLEALTHHEAYLGLVTGNLEPIAWQKMKLTGLKEFFSFGAFGSNHHDRSILVSLAIKRAKALYGNHFSNVYLIGDTVRDILAGKQARVKTIGVATGNVSLSALKAAGANLAVKSLKDYGQILDWMERH